MEHEYKLVYFNVMGRAEAARLLFAYKGVKYEDYRFTDGQFATVKNTLAFGQVPVLVVDGKPLSQSQAINRYLGRSFGMAGINDWESAQCDMYVDGVNDALNGLVPWFREQDPEKKKQLLHDVVESTLKPCIARYEGFLAANGTGHFVGNTLTWADVVIFGAFSMWQAMNPALTTGHTHVQKFLHDVAAIPNIKHWLETRPKTSM